MKLTIPVRSADHAQGPATAPLTVVQYGDYECPYCGMAYPIVKQVQQHFGAKLRFVYRNFPLTQMHPHALHAAEVAEAVGVHGRFWEIHDQLYEHQTALDDHHLLEYAARLGFDAGTIAKEASGHAVLERIRADIAGGIESGVSGTPGFFINGVKHDGDWSLAGLTSALELALAHHR